MDQARGRLIPHGWQLSAALAAGMLWLAAIALMLRLPSDVRTATLYQQRTHEGVAWFGVGMTFIACGILLLVAAALSSRAHGSGATAPWQVRLVRVLTWGAFSALFFGALVAPGFAGPDCFRTCQPFPL